MPATAWQAQGHDQTDCPAPRRSFDVLVPRTSRPRPGTPTPRCRSPREPGCVAMRRVLEGRLRSLEEGRLDTCVAAELLSRQACEVGAGRPRSARPKSITLTTPPSTSQLRGCQSPWVGTSVVGSAGQEAIDALRRASTDGEIRCGWSSQAKDFAFRVPRSVVDGLPRSTWSWSRRRRLPPAGRRPGSALHRRPRPAHRADIGSPRSWRRHRRAPAPALVRVSPGPQPELVRP